MTDPRVDIALEDLIAPLTDLYVEATGDLSTRIGGLQYDSRKVGSGDLFFCVPGARHDGHDHAAAAVSAGAVALVAERPTGTGVPEVFVSDVRRAMPLVSATALGNPARDLLVLGVTGTNGKTTTVYLLDSILRAAGHKTGLIGTIETRVGDERRPGVRTTPESLDLQRLLAEMRDAGVGAVAMEVTSHALVLNRVDGIRYSSAAFTNLTQDHLDFHDGMEDYFSSKASLFDGERSEKGAINLDDPYGRRVMEAAKTPSIGFGTTEDAEVRATDVELGPTGSAFTLTCWLGEARLKTSLVGPFNVSNCLAAAATALQAGISLDAIEEGTRDLVAVPGRFESVDAGQPFAVIVDYAHTPDSLDNVLNAARRVASVRDGRVIVTFGCGGDRDRGKRPLMGIVAAKLADVVIVTSDNPRSEVPESIVGEIVEGVVTERAEGPDAVLVDRREAIARALSEARADDIVVIAGKGHETGQEFADRTIPFDDRVVARELLRELGWDVEAQT
jgi:UDP-N-acetylmuramoyl-L-alanyl-D-glutamate--2,6-diaminopimelate ligase